MNNAELVVRTLRAAGIRHGGVPGLCIATLGPGAISTGTRRMLHLLERVLARADLLPELARALARSRA